jgi:uncharacterized membrane protein
VLLAVLDWQSISSGYLQLGCNDMTGQNLVDSSKDITSVAMNGVILCWIAVALTTIYAPTALGPFAPYATFVVLPVFGLLHGAREGGIARVIAMFVSAGVIAVLLEKLSIETGIPFGFFEHNPSMGPQIFAVPLKIGPAYFSLCYIAWMMALAITGTPARNKIARFSLTSLLAALIVVSADICADPIGSIVANKWTFREGGGYYGIPLSNFVGWFITTFLIFVAFSIIYVTLPARVKAVSKWHRLTPSVIWGLMALQYVLLALRAPDLVVQDAEGWSWQARDIFEASSLIAIYAMVPIAITSATLTWRTMPAQPEA